MINNSTNMHKIIYSIKFLLIAILATLAFDVFAVTGTGTGAGAGAATDAITKSICNLEDFIVSGPGKAVVVVVIISTGFGMFFGKITWVTAIIILVGIGITFGGPTIVSTIVGGTFTCTTGALT